MGTWDTEVGFNYMHKIMQSSLNVQFPDECVDVCDLLYSLVIYAVLCIFCVFYCVICLAIRESLSFFKLYMYLCVYIYIYICTWSCIRSALAVMFSTAWLEFNKVCLPTHSVISPPTRKQPSKCTNPWYTFIGKRWIFLNFQSDCVISLYDFHIGVLIWEIQ